MGGRQHRLLSAIAPEKYFQDCAPSEFANGRKQLFDYAAKSTNEKFSPWKLGKSDTALRSCL